MLCSFLRFSKSWFWNKLATDITLYPESALQYHFSPCISKIICKGEALDLTLILHVVGHASFQKVFRCKEGEKMGCLIIPKTILEGPE